MTDFSSIRPDASRESFCVPQAGDVIAGKYRIEAVVGTGGMGIVLSALHLRLGQSVAIKVLTMSAISEARRVEARARFLREAQAAAGLTSDHVVRVFDVGTLDSGVPYMVMELLSGDDLAAVLERDGPLPVERAVECVAQACDAIAEAHARGIAHRDLKPANLFVARKKDGRTIVKVLDFGISKLVVAGEDPLDGNLTAARSVVGSPYYMSPEQVRDAKRVDTRTDIWSLGMILYELLLGETAFDAETLPGICAAIAADPPPPIRMARADVPIDLEGVILRCLEKDRAHRFQTVNELLSALAPFLPASSTAALFSRASPSDSIVISGVPHHTVLSRPGRPTQTSASNLSLSLAKTVDEHMPPSVGVGVGAAAGAGATALRPEPAAGAVTADRTGDAPVRKRATALWLATGFAVVVVAAAASYSHFGTRSASPPAAVATSPATATTFVLTIESTPSGAQVVEGSRVLGATPLSLGIDAASVARAPRELWLKLDGHLPYRIVQGPSERDVHLAASLPALPPPAARVETARPSEVEVEPAPALALDPPRSNARKRPLQRVKASQPEASQPAPTADPSDIRLER